MASSQALPEPMNSQPHHSKVKVSITLADPTFVAGTHVSGKLQMECRADKGLGIGIMMVELFAVQELCSRDHSATSTFLHSRRLFQGPTLPPSNAVQAHPMLGDPPLPPHYYHARRGHSTFLFRIPLPSTSPSSISFGPGLAKVRYELRASVGVFWKNERVLVVDKRPVDVVEAYPYEEIMMGKVPEAIVVGENGKLWMQGKIIGSVMVAGESACLELQVKNHSTKKNTGLTLTLTRTLYLPGSATGQSRAAPVHISDTLITVPFRGPEYIIPPGAEGVANLVFDVPKQARGVRGGILDGEELEGGHGLRHSDSLFEIRCKVEVKLTMGMGSKDITLDIPVEVIHPIALPPPQEAPGFFSQHYMQEHVPNPAPYPDYNPYYAGPSASPAPMQMAYIDPIHNQVWLPPPPPMPPHSPLGYPYLPQSPVTPENYQPMIQSYGTPQAHYAAPILVPPQQPLSFPSDATAGLGGYIQRPSSAGPVVSASQVYPPVIHGLPIPMQPPLLLPLPQLSQQPQIPGSVQNQEPQAGKGERALRVSQHLRILSRNRSVSPQSHRYPLPVPHNESHSQDPPSAAALAGVSAPSNGGALSPTNLFSSPLLIPNDGGISIPDGHVVHSPRPQLTPKHSFTRDPVLGATSKSERVEELEMMADAVARKSQDLSGDLPDFSGIAATKAKQEKEQLNVNKTLPGPPVPSGKNLIPPPSRARADLYFASNNDDVAISETMPLPSDQTPPTPALLAVLPSRHRAEKEKNELKTENGLDALERRLLAEVGTRKMDIRHLAKEQRPDVRSVLPIDTSVSPLRTTAIPIPMKSPEPLHDSAISSLTLAGGLAGDESDGDFDGRTHRAGRSGGESSDARGDAMGGLHMHMRERARAGTPTKMEKAKGREKENAVEGEDLFKEGEKSKERRSSGKKKDRTSNKSAAKGRVAAWLGGIHPDIPPQEEVIPPSPSVLQNPHSLNLEDEDLSPLPIPSTSRNPWVAPEAEPDAAKDTTSPNPRSSGFVPIATLKRNTIQPPPMLLTDTSISDEARRVQDIWSSSSPPAVFDWRGPKTPLAITPIAPPLSVRTDRRVSPPSSKATPTMAPVEPKFTKPNMPLSYSAAARSKPKTPEPTRHQAMSPPPPLPPPKLSVASPPRGGIQSVYPPRQPPVSPPRQPVASPPRGRAQISFPPQKSVDLEVKYDIRSARGGRGGKVTSVANLWASGAVNSNTNAKGKELPRLVDTLEDTRIPLPTKPHERKLFSAAVRTPAPPIPKQTTVAQDNAPKPPNEAQKRPDSRALFTLPPKPTFTVPVSNAGQKQPTSSNALSTPTRGEPKALNRSRKSAEALVQKRPATALAKPFALSRPTPTTSLSTSNSSEHLFQSKTALKPVIKGSFDPAVVSSSHAVPTLSTTASLARPQMSGAQKNLRTDTRPVKLPTAFSTPSMGSLAGMSSDVPRPTSPSKPVDLAFGQARLKDLIKKYQGQVQKS